MTNPGGMDLVSKLAEVDPVFAEVMKSLVGDAVDVREAWDNVAKLDQADVHVPVAQAKKQKRQAQIGLASNALGITAGVAGLKEVAGRPAFENGGKVGRGIFRASEAAGKVPGLKQVGSAVARHPKAAAAGALGLQAANLAGDAVSNRVLARESKKKISKALDDILAARREGKISTATAAELAEKVLKSLEAPAPTLRPALRPVELAKSDDAVDYVYSGEIAKFDDDKRLVFGYASLSTVDGEPVVDRQDDYIPIEEMEKSAYKYVLESRKGGDMHTRAGEGPLHTSDLVESFIATPDKLIQLGVPEEVAKSMPTGWWVGFKVNDDSQWAKVRTGERAGFSIHGKGQRISKTLEV